MQKKGGMCITRPHEGQQRHRSIALVLVPTRLYADCISLYIIVYLCVHHNTHGGYASTWQQHGNLQDKCTTDKAHRQSSSPTAMASR